MEMRFFESEIKMPLMKLPLRSTLVKTKQGVLLISPVDFSESQLREIKKFGEIKAIIAPSILHHLYLEKAVQTFPTAKIWGTPGLVAKLPKIPWTATLTKDPWPYQDEIDLLLLEGVPRFEEVMMFCRKSQVLIVGDLCFNVTRPKGIGAWLIMTMFGTYKKFAVSKFYRKFMRDEGAFKKSLHSLLKWDFEQIVMSHGDVVPVNGRNLLEAALRRKKFLP